MHVVALDIHKRETQACITNQRGTILKETRFPTTRPAYEKNLSDYAGHAIIETVGIHRIVALWLQELGFTVHLANTSRIPRPPVKTDKRDAAHLARLFRADSLPESYLPSQEIQRLRDLVRHRHFLGQEQRRVQTKIMHDFQKHGHFFTVNPITSKKIGSLTVQKLGIPEVTSGYRVWQLLQQQVQECEAAITKETEANPVSRLLKTIPGVGAFTALVVLAEVGDFARFADKDALAAYTGLSVRQHQSGDKDTRGNITKTGSTFLRWALVQAARNHVRLCPDSQVSKRFNRIEERKGYPIAIVATARVLITVMYAMVERNEAFKLNPREPGLRAAP